jgi:hypothetical protein
MVLTAMYLRPALLRFTANHHAHVDQQHAVEEEPHGTVANLLLLSTLVLLLATKFMLN